VPERIVRDEEPIAGHLPLRGEGSFERWIEVSDEATLLATVRELRADKLNIRPIPPFHDALPPLQGLNGVALRLGGEFEEITEHIQGLRVGASVPLALVGLRRGYQSLKGAPGCLWDAYEEGWLAPMIVKVRRLKGRGFEESPETTPDPKGLLVAAWLRPDVRVQVPRAGAAFMEGRYRGLSMRELLRKVRLSGLRVRGAAFAEDDPAVLVNRGDASPRQLHALMAAVQERVQASTGLSLTQRLTAPGRGGRL
jgi:UDP-N-acetylenolpyruvoylglucosamine reductase